MHIKSEGSKHNVREFYLVVALNSTTKKVTLQKFCGSQLRTKKYELLLSEIYKAPCSITPQSTTNNHESDEESDSSNGEDPAEDTPSNSVATPRSSSRIRRKPDFLSTTEIQRQ